MTFTRKQSQSAPASAKPADSAPGPDLEGLFQQHWSRLCRMLFRIVGDWAEAEDLALDTFVRLYRRPPAEDHNLAGWLYRRLFASPGETVERHEPSRPVPVTH